MFTVPSPLTTLPLLLALLAGTAQATPATASLPA